MFAIVNTSFYEGLFHNNLFSCLPPLHCVYEKSCPPPLHCVYCKTALPLPVRGERERGHSQFYLVTRDVPHKSKLGYKFIQFNR